MSEYDIFKHRTYHLFHAIRWDELFTVVEDPGWHKDSLEADPRGFLYSLDIDRAFEAALTLREKGIAPLCTLALAAPQSALAGFGGLPLEGLIALVLVELDVMNLVVDHLARSLDNSEFLKAETRLALLLYEAGLNEKARELALRVLESITPTIDEDFRLFLLLHTGIILAETGEMKKAGEALAQVSLKKPVLSTTHQRDYALLDTEIAFWRLKANLGCQDEAISELHSILEKILDRTPPFEFNQQDVQCQLDACVALYKAGDQQNASNAIERIANSVLSTKMSTWNEPLQHVYKLAAIAQSYNFMGYLDSASKAVALLKNANPKIRKSWLIDQNDKVMASCLTALATALMGDRVNAKTYLEEIMNVVRSLDPDRSLAEMSHTLRQLGSDMGSLVRKGGLYPGRVLGMEEIRAFSEYSVGGRDQERYSKVVALCYLGKFLGRFGAYASALQLVSVLLSLSNHLAAKSEDFFDKLVGLVFPGAHPWLMVYARLLDFLLDTKDQRLVGLAVQLLDSPQSAKSILRHSIGKPADDRASTEVGNHVKTPRGLQHAQFVPTVVAGLINNGMWREAVLFLKRNSRLALSGNWPKEWMKELSANGHLDDAVDLANRKASILADLIAGLMISPSIAIFFLWFLKPEHGYLLNCVALGGILLLFLGAYYIVVGREATSGPRLSRAIRVVEMEDAVVAMIEGLLHRNEIGRAEVLAANLSPARHEKAKALVLIARSSALCGNEGKTHSLLTDVVHVLHTGRMFQKEKGEILVDACGVARCIRPNQIAQFIGLVRECLQMAYKLSHPVPRVESLSAVCSTLAYFGESELYNETLNNLVSLVGNDAKLRRVVTEALVQIEDSTVLMDLWRQDPQFWEAKDTLRNATSFLLKEFKREKFGSLLPFLQKELPPHIYAEFVVESAKTISAEAEFTKAKQLVNENLTACVDHLEPKYLPIFGELANRLDLVQEATSRLQMRLDNCKNSKNVDDYTLPQRALLLANLAHAFSELESDEARRLAVDALQLLFIQSRGKKLAGVSWHPLWNAVPSLAALGGKDLLETTWEHVSRFADVQILSEGY